MQPAGHTQFYTTLTDATSDLIADEVRTCFEISFQIGGRPRSEGFGIHCLHGLVAYDFPFFLCAPGFVDDGGAASRDGQKQREPQKLSRWRRSRVGFSVLHGANATGIR